MASKEVMAREVRGETVLLDLKTESYFGVSGASARAWQLITGGTNLREMIAVLAAEYQVGEEALTRDLERFVRDLVDAGLVTTDGTQVASNG